MAYKIGILAIMALVAAFDMIVDCLESKSASRPIPENVADVYDAEAYQTWLRYFGERSGLLLRRHLVSALCAMLLIGCNVYALIVGLFGVENDYTAACIVVIGEGLLSQLWILPFTYARDMGIEQRYGFNRMTKKIFFADAGKSLVINTGLSCGLTCALIGLHQSLGGLLVPAFLVVMLLFVLVSTFLSPVFTRIFNKLTPLEEGELRSKLQQLLDSNDCKVRNIYVMDGSKRSTKANAFFSGFGRMKTIALYDTLIEKMTPDEIVAVFAHEMGHNKHKDTLKLMGLNMVSFTLMGLILWALVSVPEIYVAFGFETVNYGFAFLLLSVCFGALSPLVSMLQNAMSRRFEYAADRFAAEAGFGAAMQTGLKKLERANFGCLNPHPLLVKLYYSHPTTSQRLEALEKLQKEAN